MLVNVYGPQSEGEKKMLWKSLLELKENLQLPTCWVGDFKAVRYKEDRRGSEFNVREAREFNNLIMEAGLTKIKLADRRFTWINKSGTSMSKLDRIFCSQCFLAIWPDLYAISKGRVISYHFSILLQNRWVDFGPKPFRVFNHWPLQGNIGQVIREAWSTPFLRVPDFRLKQQIKALKEALKSVFKSSVVGSEAKVYSLRQEKEKWDCIVENRSLSEAEVVERDACLLNLVSEEKDLSSMLQQTARSF